MANQPTEPSEAGIAGGAELGGSGPLPSSLPLSPDAAKTDHVRVIIGIRAACKEREGATLRFDSSRVQFHTDRA